MQSVREYGIFPAFCMLMLMALAGCSGNQATRNMPQTEVWTCDNNADTALKKQDYDASIRLHERFLKAHPGNLVALYHLGYGYGQIGNHEKEVFYYEKSLAMGFHIPAIYFNLGMAYGELDRMVDSIKTFKKGITANPGNSDNHFGLGLAYQRIFAHDLAEEEFLEAIGIDPEHLEARLSLGILYTDMGNMRKRKSSFQRSWNSTPIMKQPVNSAGEFISNIPEQGITFSRRMVFDGTDYGK